MKDKNLKQELSIPFCVRIRNLTDEKLYDVKVFDFDHTKQRKIEYSSFLPTVTYDQLLRQLQSYDDKKFDIVLLRHFVLCDYVKFQKKQLSCDINLVIKDSNGCESWQSNHFLIDAYQQQNSVCELETKMPFSVKSNLHYDFLMPETEIKLFLYPEKIS